MKPNNASLITKKLAQGICMGKEAKRWIVDSYSSPLKAHQHSPCDILILTNVRGEYCHVEPKKHK